MKADMRELRFECSGCGGCCYGGEDAVIELDGQEMEKIRAYLGISRGWLRRRYLVSLGDGDMGVRIEAAGHCVFLDTRQRRCKIYAVRPAQCRSYPFWPEVLLTPGGWEREARRCEGIGRGKRLPVASIRRYLRNPA